MNIPRKRPYRRCARIIGLIVLAIASILVSQRLTAPRGKSDSKKPVTALKVGNPTRGSMKITIDYPQEGSIFPPEIAAPAFLWRDEAPGAKEWRVNIEFSDGSPAIQVKTPGERMSLGEIDPRCVSTTNEPPKLTPEQAAAHTWRPDAETWAAPAMTRVCTRSPPSSRECPSATRT